jgi:hypothetical protein
MKTTKFFSVFSLALIFLGINSIYAKNVLTDNPKGPHVASVTYDVYVHLVGDNNLCNVYLVQVTDEKGNLVAPIKRYEPGVTKYTFNERGLVRGRVRIANLVRAEYPNHYVCVNDLITAPAAKQGPFLMGHTYYFDLYPQWVISKEYKKETSDQ